MAQKTRSQLRGLFDSDGIVTKSEWADVVESLWNIADDGSGGGTTIYSGDSSLSSNRTVELNQKFLKFYDTSNGITYATINPTTGDVSLSETSTNGIRFFGGDSILGDISGTNNITQLSVNDTSQLVTISSGGSTYFSVDAANNKLKILLAAIPNYADNAAAITGGLTAGNLYRTSSGGTSTLKIVQ